MQTPSVSYQILIENHPELNAMNFLLAFSGGVDSIVLADLLLKAGVRFSIAHCNFQLRGEDSDRDEDFAREYCNKNQIDFFVKKFDVNEFKHDKNFSTQMAARELRYHWFEQLMAENRFDRLLTAHHLDDSIETFLINLSRGTGIEGLLGIRNQDDKILRPLLPFSKQELTDYAKQNKIEWREDKSNAETHYVRNKIRHFIRPVLNEIHPNFKDNFLKTLDYLRSDFELIQIHMAEIRRDLFVVKDRDIFISIDKLNRLKPFETYIFHLFSEFGFKHPFEIEKLMDSANNSEIDSKTHRLVKNRDYLILTTVKIIGNHDEIKLNENSIIQKPLYLKLVKSDKRDLNATESIDFEKIKFPILLRKPQKNDVFQPLGMKGFKKISKFLKDEKLSRPEKEKEWILIDAEGEIFWIIGRRIDERFKITEHTQLFLNIYLC